MENSGISRMAAVVISNVLKDRTHLSVLLSYCAILPFPDLPPHAHKVAATAPDISSQTASPRQEERRVGVSF